MSAFAIWLDTFFASFDSAILNFWHGIAKTPFADHFFTAFMKFISFLGEDVYNYRNNSFTFQENKKSGIWRFTRSCIRWAYHQSHVEAHNSKSAPIQQRKRTLQRILGICRGNEGWRDLLPLGSHNDSYGGHARSLPFKRKEIHTSLPHICHSDRNVQKLSHGSLSD